MSRQVSVPGSWPADALTGLLRGTGYRALGTLGQGGMGTVYLVEEEGSGALLALKTLSVPCGPVLERLLREGTVQSRISHPNVVKFHRTLRLGRGFPALLMEYVEGPTLSAFLRAHEPSIDQIDSLARQVISGVKAIHQRGAVHRDIKPSNVLLAVRTDRLVAKVADLGLTRIVDQSRSGTTLTGAVLGTPDYMPPEQITAPSQVDARGDIFSLGVLLYQLATGALPWRLGSPAEVGDPSRFAALVPAARRHPGLPERMDRAISRALQAELDARPSDCDALLALWCDGSPAPPAPDIWPSALLAQLRPPAPVEPDGLAFNTFDSFVATPAEGVSPAPTPSPPLARGGPAHGVEPPPPGVPSAEASPVERNAVLLVGLVVALLLIVALAPPPKIRPPGGGTLVAPLTTTWRRLTFNDLSVQVTGVAVAPDARSVLITQKGQLLEREVGEQRPRVLALPRAGMSAVAVRWCGENAAVTVVEDGEASTWLRGMRAGGWRRLLGDARVLACSWDGDRIVAVIDGDLVVSDIGADQSMPQHLASGGLFTAAAFSPQGRSVAFTRVTEERSSLELVAAGQTTGAHGDGRPRLLSTRISPWGLAWAADGRLFTLEPRPEETDDRWASLLVYRLDSEGRLAVEARGDRVGPAAEELTVSQDGTRLAMVTTDRQRRVYSGEPDASAARQLTRGSGSSFTSSWIDGDHLAIATTTPRGMELHVVDVTTGQTRPLFDLGSTGHGATRVPGTAGAWLIQRPGPTKGELSLYWRDEQGESTLWRWPSMDYLRRRFTRCVAGPRCLLGVESTDSIQIHEVSRGGVAPLTSLPASPSWPTGWDLHPKGDRIAWRSPEGVAIRHLSTGQERLLAGTGQVQDLAWSRDGGHLVGTVMEVSDSSYAIVRIDPASGAMSTLREGSGWFSHLAVSPDSGRLAWTHTTYDVVAWLAEVEEGEAPGPSTAGRPASR